MLHGIARADVKDEIRKGMLDGWRKSQREAFIGQVGDVSKAISANVPVSWPSAEVLRLYVQPKTSDIPTLEPLRATIWDFRDIDAKKLRNFTARMFAWKGRQRAKQFLCRLTPALVARDLMTAGSRGEDIGSRLVRVTYKQQRKDTSTELPPVKVKYMPLGFAPINYHGEPILEGYAWRSGEGNKKDPGEPYEEEYPEYLVRFGAPSSLPVPPAGRGRAKGKRRAEEDTNAAPVRKSKSAKREPLREATDVQTCGSTGVHDGRQTTSSSGFKMPKSLDLSFLGKEDVVDSI
ncbi:hypothetical protein DOTSEDRAFT_74602 [Dothistroma septosporum NZE10]|uniref:Uncharacterized protein n=1 Tax=Dothistroma septosporum (strain NZE10 / CBS 128990) TaxID=675120 RepID=N1PC57_DOTSN|nr:hypothetical protein DOTSEDRAFT_74602 [Dothistroma septosporum NZE10]